MGYRRIVKYVGYAVLVLLVGIQFFQPSRINPASSPDMSFVTVAKPAPEVAAIVERSCRDCHSHDTVWPWYSRIAPVSWLVASDVRDGRRHLNFAQWGYYGPEASKVKLKDMCNEAKAGEMPLWIYTVMHPGTKLSPEDVKTLCSAAGN